MLGVDEAKLLVDDLDGAGFAVQRELHFLAIEQCTHDAQVFAKRRCLMGLKFITRMAVCPVPMPRKTRPGAMRLMEAMECAVTGAMRVPAMATPVPSRMVEV